MGNWRTRAIARPAAAGKAGSGTNRACGQALARPDLVAGTVYNRTGQQTLFPSLMDRKGGSTGRRSNRFLIKPRKAGRPEGSNLQAKPKARTPAARRQRSGLLIPAPPSRPGLQPGHLGRKERRGWRAAGEPDQPGWAEAAGRSGSALRFIPGQSETWN
jgi:hypothetical protein